jgi:hypothetical protein
MLAVVKGCWFIDLKDIQPTALCAPSWSTCLRVQQALLSCDKSVASGNASQTLLVADNLQSCCKPWQFQASDNAFWDDLEQLPAGAPLPASLPEVGSQVHLGSAVTGHSTKCL